MLISKQTDQSQQIKHWMWQKWKKTTNIVTTEWAKSSQT